ncbi:MAG: TonB-dependent receptor [Pseudomonadota bacterium]
MKTINVSANTLLFTLAALLASSNLSAQTASTQASNDVIEEIVVTGRAQTFYRVSESGFGTKTPTEFLDNPQSLQVLTRQLIEDQAARQITDLYRSISGVTKFSYSGVNFRGFRQDEVRYDGVRGDPFSGFSVSQLFNIERVEVLKGPAGMLYGLGEPGGLINYVTKKPQFERSVKLDAFAGSYNLRGASVDATGPVGERLAIRGGVFYEDRNTHRRNSDAENLQVVSGLTFQITPETELNLSFDYIDQDLGGHRLRGVPVNDSGSFLTSINYNPNEDGDFQRLEAIVGQANLSHEFSSDFSVKLALRVLENERTQNYHENRGLLSDGRTMLREYRDQLRENEEWSVTIDFIRNIELAGAEHTILFGGDYFEQDATGVFRTARDVTRGCVLPTPNPENLQCVPNIDIIAPGYGADPSTYLFRPTAFGDSTSIRWGVYVQDQISIGEHWRIVGGVRYDEFEDENNLNGAENSEDELSPRLGVVYKLNEALSLYASYSEGFAPNSIDNEGFRYEPEDSNQFEIGIKSEWLDGRFQTSAAIYEITKENIRELNPNDNDNSDGIPQFITFGEVRSRGFEIDMVGDLTDNWTMTLSYAYNDVEIIDGVTGSGNLASGTDEFANAPENTFGLWTRYDIPSINSAIAFGVDYVSDRVSFNDQRVKPYTVYDASWRTEWDQILLQINIKNLFDKEYAESGFNERNGHFPGEPRTILVQVGWEF